VTDPQSGMLLLIYFGNQWFRERFLKKVFDISDE